MTDYTFSNIVEMLLSQGPEAEALRARALEVRNGVVGDKIYMRGLIEYSNVCSKNCYYCGIRRGNDIASRYTLSTREVLDSARVALERRMGSVVIQGGENCSLEHIDKIERIIKGVKSLSDNKLGITLSLGEQTEQTLRRWFDAGAHRYLLRIESSSPEIYSLIHPNDSAHNFDKRVECLRTLKRVGYQTGTGVMIGLPTQTVEHLAEDICFMREMDIDMCGMGPYIESANTPLVSSGLCKGIPSAGRRLDLALNMVATLRLVMPDINIAATTALNSLSPDGKMMAINCGANVIMPNIGPERVRGDYSLYNNKSTDIDPRLLGLNIGFGEWGDSLHFK